MNTAELEPIIDITEEGDSEQKNNVDVRTWTPSETIDSSNNEEIAQESEKVLNHLEEAQRKYAENQFFTTHIFATEEEKIPYTMIIPESTQSNMENDSADWVVFIGGLGGIKDTYKREMIDLALAGKHVLFVAPEKGVPPTSEKEDYFNARAGTLPQTIRNKATAVALLLENLGIERASIIGHSQGGAVAAALSGMKPSLTKKLLLDNPVGIIGEDSTRGLLKRASEEAQLEKGAAESIKKWGAHLVKLLHNPYWRATKEIPGIAHTDIRPILEYMKKMKIEKNIGPEIVLINSQSDKLFTQDDIRKSLGENPLDEYVDRWVLRAKKDAGHQKLIGTRSDAGLALQIIDDPDIILQIITEVEQQQERPN